MVRVNRFDPRGSGRVPLHLGVTEAQQDRFRLFMWRRLVGQLRSGRLTQNLIERYRTELRSSNLPGWMIADVRKVLNAVGQVIEQPAYQEESSLAGDFADLSGIIDWVKEGAESVWGGVKERAAELPGQIWKPIAERIFGGPEAPAPVIPMPEPSLRIPTAPVVSPVVDTAPYRPAPVAVAAEGLGAFPWWGWLVAAGALYLAVRK